MPTFSNARPRRAAPATPLRLLALAALLGSAAPAGARTKALPRLGQASFKEVLGALTPEEKVQLVVGMDCYPSGFPPGVLPPGNPGDDKIPEKAPGARMPWRGAASPRPRSSTGPRACASTSFGARTAPTPTTPRPSP